MATDDIEEGNASAKGATANLAIHTRPAQQDASTFDIVETYRALLADDPDLTRPVAAIEAMVALLAHHESSTTMETVAVIKEQAARLQKSSPNPLPIQAGTDLFQQYLLRSLKKHTSRGAGDGFGAYASSAPDAGSGSALEDFDKTREHLVRNGKGFAARSKDARDAIAVRGSGLIHDGTVVLTAGGSRAVTAMLLRAADRDQRRYGHPRFKIVYAVPAGGPAGGDGEDQSIRRLRAADIPVATVVHAAVTHAIDAAEVDMVVVGAEALTQNGGVVSRMGTYQLANTAQSKSVKFYVAAEIHKIVRQFPLGQNLRRVGIDQTTVDFYTSEEDKADYFTSVPQNEQVDYTPPELVSQIITENGAITPNNVYEMILDLYT